MPEANPELTNRYNRYAVARLIVSSLVHDIAASLSEEQLAAVLAAKSELERAQYVMQDAVRDLAREVASIKPPRPDKGGKVYVKPTKRASLDDQG